MPRISAASVELHVQQQTLLLLDKASTLFRKNGYLATDMGDIAKAMGLARNSLYRYYPNKEHILLACVERAMEPHLAKEQEICDSTPDALKRLDKLIDEQVRFATGPDHVTMGFMHEIRSASPELREKIMDLHLQTQHVLTQTIEELLDGQPRDASIVTAIVLGMIQSSSVYILQHEDDMGHVVNELKRSVRALIQKD